MTRYFRPLTDDQSLTALGFRSDAQSVHASRTIMLADLKILLDALPPDAAHEAYERAIKEDNLLGKRTASTRLWAFKKLRELYALDPQVPVFQELRKAWARDADGQPLSAILAALARDSLLRATVPVIESASPGSEVTKADFERAIVGVRGDRFSRATMDAVLSHLVSSWTESGHLEGKRSRLRRPVSASPATVTLALALGYLAGNRGAFLFSTLWAKVLDASMSAMQDHAREASRRGWLKYRGIGDIMEIAFPHLPHS
jgi:hypothetical protein